VLLDHLGNPPVRGGLVVADRNALGSRGNSELIAVRGPTNRSGSAVNTENAKSGLPFATVVLPDISIAIVTAGNNVVGHRRPVNVGNEAGVL
jgi:hypothetical protein